MAVELGRDPQFSTLLLVQKSRAAGRALRRLLSPYYGEIRLAETPEEAELLLGREGAGPCHLVCGQNFGPGKPQGHALISAWRLRYPEIERAVLATGAESLPSEMGAVDAIYEKALPPTALLRLLGARAPETARGGPARKVAAPSLESRALAS